MQEVHAKETDSTRGCPITKTKKRLLASPSLKSTVPASTCCDPGRGEMRSDVARSRCEITLRDVARSRCERAGSYEMAVARSDVADGMQHRSYGVEACGL